MAYGNFTYDSLDAHDAGAYIEGSMRLREECAASRKGNW